MSKEQKTGMCCDPHQVVSEFYDKIMAYVMKKVRDPELAKDITQEVMGRMIDAWDRGMDVANVKAWLYQVTRNVMADRYRKAEHLHSSEDAAELPLEADEAELTTEDFIIPMIKLLPDEYSTPLYMSDIENLKQAEIAERLGLSLSAVKMRCKRARQKLHELFLECCDIQYTESGAFASCTIKSSCDVLLKEENKLRKNLED